MLDILDYGAPVALVQVGKIVRAVGLKGSSGSRGRTALAGLGRPSCCGGDGEPEPEADRGGAAQGRVWAVRSEGVSDRDGGGGARRGGGAAPREELRERGRGPALWADLEGLRVVTVAGEAVGKVTGLYETGGVDVLVVTGEGGEKLVPLAPYVEVDSRRRRIVVDPPEGLLD